MPVKPERVKERWRRGVESVNADFPVNLNAHGMARYNSLWVWNPVVWGSSHFVVDLTDHKCQKA